MTDDAAQASFLQRAVSGAVDATVGRVEDRVVSSTKGVIDDLEPYLAEETVPRIVDALMPYLIERVVPEVIAGLTERLATETGPAIVEGMTPQLADELVPVLLERMRPYLEAELVPAVVDGVTPYIIDKAGPQIVAGLMPYIQAEVVPEILDEFVDDPRVRDLIREQSLGLLWDAVEVLRGGSGEGRRPRRAPAAPSLLPRTGDRRDGPRTDSSPAESAHTPGSCPARPARESTC